ncbi:hypothetical protein KL936_000776 [Ogataea polymorpha]|nr:hypothetical protein KL936_000776 [Ogataea polymorpha]
MDTMQKAKCRNLLEEENTDYVPYFKHGSSPFSPIALNNITSMTWGVEIDDSGNSRFFGRSSHQIGPSTVDDGKFVRTGQNQQKVQNL